MRSEPQRRTKVAIVGMGHISRYQVSAIRQLADVELVGAYDKKTFDKKGGGKRALPCRFYRSLDELIDKSPADVVVVSTPNADHFATASRLISAGRAVLVEKPVCETLAEVKKLAALARARKVFFHTALHAAFARDLEWWLENRDRLARRFGPLTGFQMGFYDPYIERDGTVRDAARGLGGSWYDSGINALSVLEKIADPGSIRVVSGRMFSSAGIACSQVRGTAQLECRVDGVACRGEIDTDWMLGLNRKITILSYARASVILDHSAQTVVIRGPKTQSVSLQNGKSRLTNQYAGVFRDLAAYYARGKDNAATALRLHELLFAAANA